MRFVVCIFFVLCASVHSASSQLIDKYIVKGYLLNAESRLPIPYANVSVVGAPVGTITDTDGSFTLNLSTYQMHTTFKFSALGFKDTITSLNRFADKSRMIMTLREIATYLQSATVETKRTRGMSFGNAFSQGGINLCSVEGSSAGSAIALLIENKGVQRKRTFKYPTSIRTAQVRIIHNTMPSFKIRVRVYDVDSITGLPSHDLLKESVLLTSDIKSGWLKFDLRSYHVRIDGSFFIAFEWISDSNERMEIAARYLQFEKENPDKVIIVQTRVSGKSIDQPNYLDFLDGTSLGISAIPLSLRRYKSFARYNSNGTWMSVAYVLAAKVTLN